MAVATEQRAFNFPSGIRRLVALPALSGSGQVVLAALGRGEGAVLILPPAPGLACLRHQTSRRGKTVLADLAWASLGLASCPRRCVHRHPCVTRPSYGGGGGQNRVSPGPRPSVEMLHLNPPMGQGWCFQASPAGRVGPYRQPEGQAGLLVISVLISVVPWSASARQRQLRLERNS